MPISGLVERLRASARKKRNQFQKVVNDRVRSKKRDQNQNGVINECEIDVSVTKSSGSSALLADDRSFKSYSTTASSVITSSLSSNSQRHSFATDEGDSVSPQGYYGIIKRKAERGDQLFALADADFSHASTATLTVDRGNDVERVVFLQYQGETKRSILPTDSNENSTKTSLRTLDDVRCLFVKSFPDLLPLEYLRSANVKIYIQDSSKTDFFYELDDLSEIKDRSVLKLHEPLTRPNSPPPPPTQPIPSAPDHQSPITLDPEQLDSSNRYHRHQSSDDMNYFSEPEFDAAGEYRLQKSASANYYGGVNSAYQQQKRQYGTLDRFYGYPGSGRGSVRMPFHGSAGVPPKPERHFGPGIPSGGRASVRGSYSPPRRIDVNANRGYGHQSDHEEAYSRIGYRDYVASPTAESAVDALYHQRNSTGSSRSGSITPVIDEEARVRMMNMEKQLANLSSLVHSALMSKGVSETVYKDLEMLRKEIMGSGGPPSSSRDDASDSGSVSRLSDLSSEKGSYQSNTDRDGTNSAPFSPLPMDNLTPSMPHPQPTSCQLTPDAKHTLKNAKRRVTEVQGELKNLRRMAQLNAQCSRDILKDAFDRIKVILNTNQHLHMFAAQAQQQNLAESAALSGDRKWVNHEEERYRNETRKVEKGLQNLEKEVEDLRQKVVNGQRKLRMSEVESFTDSLTQIGKTAANLKNNFPTLENRLKSLMTNEMEKVVKEEKFLKDEPTRLDNALKRCKKLANTMVTMKKLAMVQDPSAYYGSSKRPPLPSKSNASGDFETSSTGAMSPPPTPSAADHQRRALSPTKESRPIQSSLVNGGGSPRSDSGVGPTSHALDNLLEELQNVAIHKKAATRMGSNEAMEKRVGFADEVQVLQRVDLNASSDSDTIKRSPKLMTIQNQSLDNGGVNSILRTTNFNTAPIRSPLGPYPERRSASPSPMATSFRAAIPFLHGGRLGALGAPIRSHSNTPTSVASEPAIFRQQDKFGFPPAPPPRISSRHAVGGPLSPSSDITPLPQSSAPTVLNFRSEFERKQRFFTNGSQDKSVETPTAIVQTNAVDDEPRFVKSASSSESVNSQQEATGRRAFGNNLEPPKPPPPPPPRNKQEMLEQRQHELIKQAQNRYVKFKLPSDG